MPEWEENWPWERLKTDASDREAFLEHFQPFIRYVASRVVKRSLEWGRDEELSEAFLAFNQALNLFQPDKGVPFLAYARLLIKRQLIDYFRRHNKPASLPLDEEEVGFVVETYISVPEFYQQEQNRERAAEVQDYSEELAKWGLTFANLVEVSPKHRDTRESLLRAARELAHDSSLWSQVERTKRLPMQQLSEKTGLHLKVLERGRKYILAVAILIARSHDYIYLREYVYPQGRSRIS
ncbi:RNA polymerase sigma-I factor [Desulfosporosinus sp. Sb-LF]|uniref:RNA polymerase sigma-I factor n=1 Tax=Desulfosporosinus sp. Sb-LF TaxID=2560027 RepID=UPI00107F15DC|nr:RNA polymerase sigma-I factor [Desulfosporosinus sp. Sb-LF]TGE31684.1 RNA polymerase sigma-I factor [Desulfosporosinus sp. Sb-LF]